MHKQKSDLNKVEEELLIAFWMDLDGVVVSVACESELMSLDHPV